MSLTTRSTSEPDSSNAERVLCLFDGPYLRPPPISTYLGIISNYSWGLEHSFRIIIPDVHLMQEYFLSLEISTRGTDPRQINTGSKSFDSSFDYVNYSRDSWHEIIPPESQHQETPFRII